MRRVSLAGAAAIAVIAAGLSPGYAADANAVVKTYADIAHAMYEDSLLKGQELKESIAALIETPDDAHLQAARDAWRAARVPYQQTEVYRFGNPLVDDWEGKVNAWPLDEGLIDYVDASYGTDADENEFYTANIIANPTLAIGGQTIDATTIDTGLIQSLHEIDEVEANVATGYHVIEFLLWGQDLNGTEAGAGARPASDFDAENCTGGNCDRRSAYLQTATDLLLTDLEAMVAMWADDGEARAAVTGDPKAGLRAILTGLGSLSYGELAGERMKLGLLLHDPEEEHDCFSDNTHNSHYYDIVGMSAIYGGSYGRSDGSKVEGPGIGTVLPDELDQEIQAKLEATLIKATEMKQIADRGEMAYDQMLGEDNPKGNAVIEAVIAGLLDQTKSIEKAVSALELGSIAFEGSDSLDSPEAVFQ